jgi:hypothetical protein
MDPEWLEVDVPTPIKLVKKILIPIYRHPEVCLYLCVFASLE